MSAHYLVLLLVVSPPLSDHTAVTFHLLVLWNWGGRRLDL